MTQNLQLQLELEADPQVIETQKKYNIENGEEYVCRAYRNSILESNVGQTSFENKRKTYKA